MKNELDLFKKNIKVYIDYLMTLDFKKLGIHFFSLVFIIFIGLLVYLPISLISDSLIQGLGIIPNIPVVVFSIIDWIFVLISFVVFVYVFMYMFNRRFEEVYEQEINEEMNKETKLEEKNEKIEEEKVEEKQEDDEMELTSEEE